MKLNEIEISRPWFLYFEFTLTSKFDIIDAKYVTREIGRGKKAYFTDYSRIRNTASGEVVFNSAEEAWNGRKVLRRLTRGQPRFITKKVFVSQEPKIADTITRIHTTT